ncbi:RHS repeat-associated core domain-containing protein [Flavobacterium kingsejongi]|nr:RHS repeat-associated core domain-containing protein [Flavobacterium kingsejongi]
MFQGQYYDEEVGLAYNRFRYYDPEEGRYRRIQGSSATVLVFFN